MARIQIGPESIYYTGHNLSCSRGKTATAIVFIHGSGGSHKSWPVRLRSNIKEADRSRSVYLLDLPGHGRSTGRGRRSIKAYADFIDDFVTTLSLPHVILAGHSLGGAIALQSALRQPPWLAGLILAGTGARLRVHPDILNGVRRDYADTVDLICQWAFGPDASMALIDGSRKALLETDPDVTWGDFSACNAFDVVSRVGEINCPALIVSGADDHLTPPRYGALLNEKIKNSQYRLIQRAGHMMAIEKPEAFMAGIKIFLSELSRSIEKDAGKKRHPM
ncbi:MAG: alpha/beta hydrolase [Deltaproteobacteria bacterium]|nr:MAG: alpha/beta hydrolase [Deltaproteobacteria bacterium]